MRQRIITTVGVVLATLVAFAGAALATEVVDAVGDVVLGDDEPTTLTVTDVEAMWDEDAGVVIISVGSVEGEAGPCDGLVVKRNDDEDADEPFIFEDANGDPVELLPGCLVFDGTGKDGKVNHGTMVSGVARMLSPHDLDGPKGHIMREVAKLKQGDDIAAGEDDGVDADDDGPKADKPDKPEKPEKPEKPDKPGKNTEPNGKAKGRNK